MHENAISAREIPLQDALSVLELTPQQVGRLGSRERTSLLSFLLRWEQYPAALACLEVLLPLYPDLVSLRDDHARALWGLGQHAVALQVIRGRQELKDSPTARILEGRILLAAGDSAAALRLAQALAESGEESLLVLGFLAEVHLARGEHEAALARYRRMNALNPESRAYWLGMMALHQALGDWVTASGYAVRLERNAAEGRPLSVSMLRRLHDYYRSSGEANRAAGLDRILTTRYADELEQLRAALAGLPARVEHRPLRLSADEPPLAPESPELPTAAALPPVSPAEQRRIEQAAHDLFGHEQLLPGQLQTLAASLRGEDVLTILRTGGGKSLCYQLPAFMAERGVTLVVSPLIALMKDQVDALPPLLRPRATALNSALDGEELHQRLAQLAAGRVRLVYAAPERLRQVSFLHALRRVGINRLVIDEAHCVSLWGHDFRPDYLTIGRARHLLGNPPVLAMTATAPPRVRHDILQRMDIPAAAIIAGETCRPNLYLGAVRAKSQDEKLAHLLTLCQREVGSGVIYVNSRERAEQLAQLLNQRGISAGYYHAGIGDRVERAAAQDTFMSGQVRVMVATVAFGMGIDKADIRFIIHYDLPASLEAYYQEAGRAGRDSQSARCMLLYSSHDRGTLTQRANRDRIPVELLRAIYAAARRRLGGPGLGRVPLGDLARDVSADETPLRVALSLLEEAGLLRRHQDMPHHALVQLAARGQARQDTAFEAFASANRLSVGQSLPLDLLLGAQAAGLDPRGIEEQLLSWADAGWLSYRPAGRDLLLEMLPVPPDAVSRVQELLDRYTTLQVQRVEEVMAYAMTRRCRHGHISAYLSGHSAERCRSCDNCQPEEEQATTAAALPTESEQMQTILRAVAAAPWGWGRMTLLHILRGDGKAPDRGRDSPGWAHLDFRSETAISQLINRLLGHKLLRQCPLDFGGVVLDLTAAGNAALHDASKLPTSTATVPATAVQEPTDEAEVHPEDQSLLDALRAWRRKAAAAAGVPPFMVAHDSLLQRLAALAPRDQAQLANVKGMGPKKLAQYGAQLIETINGHDPGKATQ